MWVSAWEIELKTPFCISNMLPCINSCRTRVRILATVSARYTSRLVQILYCVAGFGITHDMFLTGFAPALQHNQCFLFDTILGNHSTANRWRSGMCHSDWIVQCRLPVQWVNRISSGREDTQNLLTSMLQISVKHCILSVGMSCLHLISPACSQRHPCGKSSRQSCQVESSA